MTDRGFALVQRVADNSPASKLGLKGGNIRAQIEGQEIILGGDIILAVAGIRSSNPFLRWRVSSMHPQY